MESSDQSPKAACAQEALQLLNCVTESPYDEDKCRLLLQSLRQCVLSQKVKKFSLAEEKQGDSATVDEKKGKLV